MKMPVDPLTEREQDILRLLSKGLSDSEIAEEAVLTVGTVKWYNRQIYSKLGVSNRTQAVTQAQRLGLLEAVPEEPASPVQPRPRHNLPAQVTSFIGRSDELVELKSLLKKTRLLTLTGPPGTGKTRLAYEAAREVLDDFPDGVFSVSLASVDDAAAVDQSIAQVMGVAEKGGSSLIDTLKRYLHDKTLLLILDNFEHLLPAASLVSTLLGAAPHLTVLVTSREILRLYGEHEFPVPPLQLPDLKQQMPGSALQSYEAIELFVLRAQAASPEFALNDHNTDSVAAICVHVDGLPLAIELAAARIKFYAPQTLLLHLGSRLEALSTGPRDLPARQRTLRATLAWSFDLLSDEEKVLFTRLGVFAGGCTLEDAEVVCADNLNLNVATGIESLLNKSLLKKESNSSGELRFMMLETMREYALEQLDERGETAFIREQHSRYFVKKAEAAAREFFGPREPYWLVWLEAQHDNLRTALQWCLTSSSPQDGLRLVSSLARFWEIKGYLSEGRAWLSQAMNLPGADEPTRLRADALRGAGDLAYRQSDYAATQTLYEDALAIYRELEDEKNIAHALLGLGEVATEIGDYDTAPRLFQEAYTIMHQRGDVIGSARAKTQLGWGDLRVGNYKQAQQWLEEALALYEKAEDKVGTALVYSGLGEIALRCDQLDEAATLLESSLELRRENDEKWGIAVSLGSLGWVSQLQGQLEHATELLTESLLIRQEIGDQGGMAWCLEKLAETAHLRSDGGRAVRTFGAAASLRASVDSVIDPADQPAYEHLQHQLRSALTADVYEALWAEGQAMTLEQVIAYVLRAHTA